MQASMGLGIVNASRKHSLNHYLNQEITVLCFNQKYVATEALFAPDAGASNH